MVLLIESELVTVPGWSDQNPSLVVQLNGLLLMFEDLLSELWETQSVFGWGVTVFQELVVIGEELPGFLFVSLLGHRVQTEGSTAGSLAGHQDELLGWVNGGVARVGALASIPGHRHIYGLSHVVSVG